MKQGTAALRMVPLLALLAACGDGSTGPDPSQIPLLDSIAPARGTVGTEVAIYGTQFSAEGVEVHFSGLPSPRVEPQNGVLYALAPAGLVAGSVYDVRVVNTNSSGSDTLAAVFEAVAPRITMVNGVRKASGLVGMTLIVEGEAFGDVADNGKVFFLGADGAPIQATIANPAEDWANTFVVTTVPQNVANPSKIWVETATGVSDSVHFELITGGLFSPSLINWTKTTELPQPLTGLGAAFVPVEEGDAPANYVFTVGGADTTQTATTAVYRSVAQESGALGAWEAMTALPEARAYHTTVAATAYTAALDSATAAYLYAIGGRDTTGAAHSTVYFAKVELDGSVGAWQTTTALPVPMHSARAALFRGYVYLAGGADSTNTPLTTLYRARLGADGQLGEWEAAAELPGGRAYHSLTNFGPYLYLVGGETGAVSPELTTLSGTETSSTYMAAIAMRTGDLRSAGWTAVAAPGKARSKHSTIFAGGALLTTSGIYSGNPGSSENTYAVTNNDGTLGSWGGATGSETISAELGYSLYNQAVINFVDSNGNGHVLVLGGAKRGSAVSTDDGKPSAGVVYY